MSSLVWICDCPTHGLIKRDIKKSVVNRHYTLHVKSCLEVNDVYCLELDERFTIS